MTRSLLALALACSLAWATDAVAQVPDSAATTTGVASIDALDRIQRATYLRRHAFSLDHFLEFEPGGFLVRLGPIGNEANYSRWGIGRGRARVRLNGIVMNDPQDDTAPLVHIPTSGLGTLSTSRDVGTPWIEGSLDIDEQPSPLGRPNTYVELSKGTRAVRQRRVRFSSEASKVGVDLAYDEVLDDGYMFDASGNVPYATNYGSARTRQSTIVLRGEPDAVTRFDFGVRNFRATTQGDLVSNAADGRKSGYLTWLGASAGDTRMTVFGRGYSSSVPDSSAESATVGALGSWSRGGAASDDFVLRAGIERTNGIQVVDSVAEDRVVRATGGIDAKRAIGSQGRVFASASVAGDNEVPFAWGASVGVRRAGAKNSVGVVLARSFRLPNFAERYLPAHDSAGRTIAGDRDVDPETALEVTGDWEYRLGAASSNRVRASWIRAEDAIAFRPRPVGAESWRVASNASDAGAMFFAEERVTADFRAASLRFLADAAVLFTSGDRADAFASVPEFQVNASFMFGRAFFEETSALYLGAQFMSVSERSDFEGTGLPAFQVVNLMLEGRLLDARLYLQYLNLTDEVYRTQGDYLMTPRTFVYGIEWTLFN